MRWVTRAVRSLSLWVRCQQHEVPTGAVAISHGHGGRTGFALLAITAVELIAVELLIPWP